MRSRIWSLSRSSSRRGDASRAGITTTSRLRAKPPSFKADRGAFAFTVFTLGIVGTGLLADGWRAPRPMRWASTQVADRPGASRRKPFPSMLRLPLRHDGTLINFPRSIRTGALLERGDQRVVAVPVMIVMMLMAADSNIMGNSPSPARCGFSDGPQRCGRRGRNWHGFHGTSINRCGWARLTVAGHR